MNWPLQPINPFPNPLMDHSNFGNISNSPFMISVMPQQQNFAPFSGVHQNMGSSTLSKRFAPQELSDVVIKKTRFDHSVQIMTQGPYQHVNMAPGFGPLPSDVIIYQMPMANEGPKAMAQVVLPYPVLQENTFVQNHAKSSNWSSQLETFTTINYCSTTPQPMSNCITLNHCFQNNYGFQSNGSISMPTQDMFTQQKAHGPQSFMSPYVTNIQNQTILAPNQGEMMPFLNQSRPQEFRPIQTNNIQVFNFNGMQQSFNSPQVQEFFFIPLKPENFSTGTTFSNHTSTFITQLPINNVMPQIPSAAMAKESSLLELAPNQTLFNKTQKPSSIVKQASENIFTQPMKVKPLTTSAILSKKKLAIKKANQAIPKTENTTTEDLIQHKPEPLRELPATQENNQREELKSVETKDPVENLVVLKREEEEDRKESLMIKEENSNLQKLNPNEKPLLLQQILSNHRKEAKRRRKNERSCFTMFIKKLRKKRELKQQLNLQNKIVKVEAKSLETLKEDLTQDYVEETITLTRVGPQYQVYEIPSVKGVRTKRSPKIQSNPEDLNSEKFNFLLEEFEQLLKQRVTEEKVVRLLRSMNYDSQAVIDMVRENPKIYKKYFSLRRKL